MKKQILFVATLAVGVIVGAISQHITAHAPTTSVQTGSTPTLWEDTEEGMLGRMNALQERLNALEKADPDSLQALSRQIDTQAEIEGLLTKYREAKQAKWAPYIGAVGTVAAATITGIGTGIGTWLVARRKSKRTADA